MQLLKSIITIISNNFSFQNYPICIYSLECTFKLIDFFNFDLSNFFYIYFFYLIMRKSFVPLRQFIYDRLYHPKLGYFCRKDYQVGELKAPINFKKLIGFDDYQRELVQKYPANAWLTPCQIFKPYYGMTIANYIRKAHQVYKSKNKVGQKIKIVQAGAGTGSAAESILYYFKNFDQKSYQKIDYTIVQISPTLCKRIQQKLSKQYPHMFQTKQITIINDDIMNFKTKQLSYLMFFEVLDNMPHDKVIYDKETKNFKTYSKVDLESMQQIFQDIQKDKTIQKCLQLFNKSETYRLQQEKKMSFVDKIANKLASKIYQKGQSANDLFLPTFFHNYMEKASRNVPNAHFIISDFDHLFSAVPGRGAPIVSSKGVKSHQKKDYDTYLVERGAADIFFPVNFHHVNQIHKHFFKKQGKVIKSFQFIDEFSEPEWALTKSMFNPIKEDFGNTSFFVTHVEQK